jgi:hypothetical protein
VFSSSSCRFCQFLPDLSSFLSSKQWPCFLWSGNRWPKLHPMLYEYCI